MTVTNNNNKPQSGSRGAGGPARGAPAETETETKPATPKTDSGDAAGDDSGAPPMFAYGPPPCCWNCGAPPAPVMFAGPAPPAMAGARGYFFGQNVADRSFAPRAAGAPRSGRPFPPVPTTSPGARGGYSNPDPYGCGWFYNGTGLCGPRGVAPPMAGARDLPPMRGAPQYVHGGDEAYGPPPSWFYGSRGSTEPAMSRCGGAEEHRCDPWTRRPPPGYFYGGLWC
ncbi:hypothetical protein H9P43_002084 [Blastocladiella emersonii ATCC 22665]|nr:hypothetical protein H9P43_002084 [Blastocladiella emersonii ATCC 22665]